eukprot:2982721-Amphidinium_carterae.2
MALCHMDGQIAEAQTIHNLSTTPQLHLPSGRQFTKHDSTTPKVSISHIEFADDIVLPLTEDTNQRLMQAINIIVPVVYSSLTTFGLTISADIAKTNILLRLVGPSSRGIWQYLKSAAIDHEAQSILADMDPTTQDSVQHDHHPSSTTTTATASTCATVTSTRTLPLRINETITIHIASHYKHLGKLTNATLGSKEECAARCTATLSAFSEHRRILTRPSLSIHYRLQLYHTLCLPHLLQNVHTTPYTTSELNRLNRTHMRLLRRICGVQPQDGIEDSAILETLGERPLMSHIAARPYICAPYFSHSFLLCVCYSTVVTAA